MRMSARKTAHQVWHVSRGIVFAGGSNVVYPRLPQVRHHSAPAAVASEGDPVCLSPPLPTVPSTTNAPEKLAAGQEPGNAHGEPVIPVVTTATTTTVNAISVIPTSAFVEEGAAKQDGPPAQDVAETPKPKNAAPVIPPHTPLDFKIPDKVYQDARNAAEGSPDSFWGYAMYRGADDDAKVKVHYCTSSATTERVIKRYFMHEEVLGFDLEWMANVSKSSGARKNVSLVQLASPSRVGLFHIAVYPGNDILVAPALKELMENPAITKVGVSVKGDCTRLAEFLQIKARGLFELSHLYKLVKYSQSGEHTLINKKLVSLATQVKEYLGLPMFKGLDVRTSNWTKSLRMDQIMCQLFHLPDIRRFD